MSRKKISEFSQSPRQLLYLEDSNIDLNYLVSLLVAPSTQRPPSSIKSLQALTKNIPFFKQLISDYEERAHIECCMYLKYQMIEKNSTIFSEGDEGDLFYIVLKGTVKVLLPVSTKKSDKDTTILTAGSSFGELALIKNKPRSATIFTLEDTHFAVLSKKDFIRILGTFTNKHFDELTKFLKNLPLFAGWSFSTLVRLNYLFVLVKFKRNQKLFKEGESAEFVYIVKKGELELSKDILVKSPKHVIFGHHGRPLKSTKKQIAHLQGKFSIVGTGEFIGEDDVMNGEVYTKTCTCYSTVAEVLQIPAGEFKKRIRSEDSLSILAEKHAFRQHHLNSAVKIIKEIKTPQENLTKMRSLNDLKISSDIKALNLWNQSMKGSKMFSPESFSSFRSAKESNSPVNSVRGSKLAAKLKHLWK